MEPYQDQAWNGPSSESSQHAQSQPGDIQPSRRTLLRAERERLGALRTAIACGACRERKTRCSGQQPTCSYCRRVGIECVYKQTGAVRLDPQVVSAKSKSPAADGFEEWGVRILNGIDHLAESLETRRHVSSGGLGSSSTATLTSPASNREASRDDATHLLNITIESPSAITSVASILAWDVFNFGPDKTPFPFPVRKSTRRPQQRGHESGNTSVSQLMSLSSSFMSFYSFGIPIFDGAEVEDCISEISENGAQWSAESCLVFLVAALGSGCQRLPDSNSAAFRYWNMAKKRLGWALEEESLLSVRCLLLAGVWHLQNSEPSSAWRMFHNAILMIHGCPNDHGTKDGSSAQEGQSQNLLAICLIFQCKLQSELELPVPQSTTGPYKVNIRHTNEFSNSSAEAELHFRRVNMSLLQIRQDCLHSFKSLQSQMSWMTISNISTDISMLQSRLDKWYKDLQPYREFAFVVGPDGDHARVEGYHRTLLQYQYFDVKELILRPWLYICLHIKVSPEFGANEGASEIEQTMHAHFAIKSGEMAVQHQRATLLRLSLELEGYKKQSLPLMGGLWFKANNCLVLSLLLLAPHLQRANIPGISQGLSHHWFAAVGTVEALLAASDASELERQYASVLHSLSAQ